MTFADVSKGRLRVNIPHNFFSLFLDVVIPLGHELSQRLSTVFNTCYGQTLFLVSMET